MKPDKMYETIKSEIMRAYEEGVSMPEAEKLAALTLAARIEISEEIKAADLDAKMRKQGVKAVRGGFYLKIIKREEKKPTEAMIAAEIETYEEVNAEEAQLSVAEVESARLKSMLDLFKDAHLYFRQICKGTFE